MIETTGTWFGDGSRPLAAWLTRPAGSLGATGVLIVPAAGYESFTSYRTLRVLAESLAGQGCTVLRVDVDGAGDSAGDQWDMERLASWRQTVREGASELRRLGADRLVLVGLRLGATLALLEARAAGADAVVAWAPIVSGRRYVKELRLVGTEVPDLPDRPETAGAVVFAGTAFSAGTLADLATLDLTALDAPPAPRTLLLDVASRPPSASLEQHLRTLGGDVERREGRGSEQMLDEPTEYATVPHEAVADICAWVGTAQPATAPAAPGAVAATIPWSGDALVEEFVTLGPSRLAGVVGRPRTTTGRATVVFLNTGSEPHTGPGRAWVEYARSLTLAGFTTLRADFSGWGESPDLGRAPGRPYDAHTVADTCEIVAALREEGHSEVVLVGLCASAWIGLTAVLQADVAGVVAINPQLYWAPGDPVEATMTETRARRTDERAREARGGRLGVWTLLDAIGVRHRVSTWLRRLRDRGTPVLMLFAEGDDGLEFFENRTRRALREVVRSGVVEVDEIPGIDHPMHRHWLRGEVLSRIEAFLARVTTAP